MFVGEMMLFLVVMRERNPSVSPVSSANGSAGPRYLPWYYFGIPACLDVLGSGLSGVSMLFISASVWQMLRGSMIVYTAILSVVFLNRRLQTQHVTGLLVASLGLSFVGVSAYLDSESSPSLLLQQAVHLGTDSTTLVIFGIGLTVLSQFCSAIQVVVEEYLLKTDGTEYACPSPARVVSYEGLWGFTVMLIVLGLMQVIPGVDHGSYENSIDSIEKMSNSGTLLLLIIIYCVSIALFNQCGMTVSKNLSSLHRTLIDSLRALVVWGTQLVIYYTSGSTAYGLAWTSYSWIQMAGFFLLVLGTLMYNEVVIIYRVVGPEQLIETQPIMQDRL
jgi:drug/metabolite transporter (DMT)-like permease